MTLLVVGLLAWEVGIVIAQSDDGDSDENEEKWTTAATAGCFVIFALVMPFSVGLLSVFTVSDRVEFYKRGFDSWSVSANDVAELTITTHDTEPIHHALLVASTSKHLFFYQRQTDTVHIILRKDLVRLDSTVPDASSTAKPKPNGAL